jgi:hypothetical protein
MEGRRKFQCEGCNEVYETSAKRGLYVVAVAKAKGGKQLVEALLDLAAAAVAWAVHLSRH